MELSGGRSLASGTYLVRFALLRGGVLARSRTLKLAIAR
jgi:hypothetical protein